MEIRPAQTLRGSIRVPGDKSISHRAVMLGAIAKGKTKIIGFLPGADCLSTIGCFRSLGVEIEGENEEVVVHGRGLHGLAAPEQTLWAGNSGTTTRLMSGLLSGQPFESVLDGDSSLRSRPMGRVTGPLRQMGAEILDTEGKAPLTIRGGHLRGIRYVSPVASAQVKSCLLLAGLYAEGETEVREPALSRDHTERMLTAFGGRCETGDLRAKVWPEPELLGQEVIVPGDISSAAYFLAAGLLVPDAEVRIHNVGVNPTRDGILRVAEAMGGRVRRENERISSGEPVCDLVVRSSTLHGTEIGGALIPTLIDEVPVIAVMAAMAAGDTVIRDAAELKVKETDRIRTVSENLRALGVAVEEKPDGMVIHGGHLTGGTVRSFGDHRIAMAFAVAGLAAEGPVEIQGSECVDVSYPGFFRDLEGLR